MVPLTASQRKVLDFIIQQSEVTGSSPTLREIAHHCGWKSVASAQDVVAVLRKKGFIQHGLAGKSRQIILEKKYLSHKDLGGAGTGRRKSSSPSTPFVAALEVPLLGQVRAGLPQEAMADDSLPVFAFPLGEQRLPGVHQDYFALRVEGYSMLHAGMLPGDLLLVQQVPEAQNQDIVVASVQSLAEVTVKRLAVRGSQLYQQARSRWEGERHEVGLLPFKNSKKNLQQESIAPWFLVPENPDFSPLPFGTAEADAIWGIVRALWRPEVSSLRF